MSRSCLTMFLTGAFAVTAVAQSEKARADGQTATPKRPNVLLIIADDLGYADIGCAGLASDVRTPNIDRLAERGIRFTSAYATSPICNASRAGLLTGCYQQRFGTFWYGGDGLHDDRFVTLAELMQRAGYATGYVGKFHYGGRATYDTTSRSFPLQHGFDELFGFAGGRKHYLIHSAEVEAAFRDAFTDQNRAKPVLGLNQGPMWVNDQLQDQQGFSTELFGRQARRFMRRHRARPFFLTLSFNAVHNFTHQLPPEYLAEHGLKGMRDWDPAVEEYLDWYRKGRYPNNPEGRAHYLGQLHYMDREIGLVLDELSKLGIDRRTLVIFIGDNGGSTPIYANNGPLRGSKFTLYEGGIRVPMIVSWAGELTGGRVVANVASAMDILPTVCRATGIDAPDHVNGMDLMPLLSAQSTNLHHKTLIWDIGHEYAVRDGKWKLHVAKNNKSATFEMVQLEVGEFLRDLETDPGERVNAAEANPEVVTRLQRIYSDWRASLGR